MIAWIAVIVLAMAGYVWLAFALAVFLVAFPYVPRPKDKP